MSLRPMAACGRCRGRLRGGLAPWQERRAKEILSANLDGDVPLKDVARECRLSVSHFSRAFRRTVGVAPHQLAGDASHRSRQGEVAQYPIVAVGCGVGLRLRRSKPPDPGLHRNGRRQSGRLASRPRRTSSRRSATQPIKRSLVTHLLSNCLGAFNARPTFGPYALFHSCHDRKIQDRFFKK